jgi:chromosome partitioning protein
VTLLLASPGFPGHRGLGAPDLGVDGPVPERRLAADAVRVVVGPVAVVVGTELVASAAAIRQGRLDVSAGNVFGSCLVDLDPQPASLAAAAGRPAAKTADGPTVTDVLPGDAAGGKDLRGLVIGDEPFDPVSGHESLAPLESTARAEGISTVEFLLRSTLAPAAVDYDHVIVDPLATLTLLVDNALIATGNVLGPIEMTRKGERSIGGVLDTVQAPGSQLQRAQPDFSLRVIGILPNRVEGSSLNQSVRETLTAEVDGVSLLPVTLPDYNVLERSWDAGPDISRHAEQHGLRAYQESLLDGLQLERRHRE